RARQLLEDLDEIERATGSARTEAVGRLRISTPLSFGDLDFSAIVTDFQLAHPGIETHVAFENRFVDPVAEGYDAVIRVAEPDETTTLVDHRIRRLDYLLAAAPAYLAAHGTPGRARELADHATLYLRRDAGAAAWALEGPGGPESVALRPVLQANNFETLLTAARSGLGIAMMPEYAVRSEIEGGRLVQVLADLALPARMLQVIYPPSRHLSARLRLFVDFVEARCGG
ncbi:MAG: substrate binding domain-containing protein, partial [Pseudomonadota bacterium]